MPASGRVWVDEKARAEIERGALHVYIQHVVRAEARPGEWVEIVHGGETLGYGLYNPRSSIPVKIFSRDEIEINEYVARRLEEAHRTKSKRYGDVFRWIFAEGDRVPGLIVDRFRDVAVVRYSVLGLERVLGTIADVLQGFGVEHVYLKNVGGALKKEGIKEEERFLVGKKGVVEIQEGEARFIVDVVRGQKTGFYLDQRENRIELEKWVGAGDRVLDVFAYTGGFGIHAAIRGARVTFVEMGRLNAEMLKRNMEVNGVEGKIIVGNALDVLRKERQEYDIIVLDPPALAKEGSKEGAKRTYFELNRRAVRLLDGGILVSCSCSHPITPKDFLGILRAAAEREGKTITLLGSMRGQAPDHTVYLPQPETQYLKCVFGVVE